MKARLIQLSVIIIRYLTTAGEINESLIAMLAASKCDGENLTNYLLECLEKYDLDVNNIRGQCYDGCSTMTGQYKGVKSRILSINSKAYFVHCYAHRLNLVLVDTLSKNTYSRNFFGVVGQLCNLIEGSAKRHLLFQSIQKQLAEGDSDTYCIVQKQQHRRQHHSSTTYS